MVVVPTQRDDSTTLLTPQQWSSVLLRLSKATFVQMVSLILVLFHLASYHNVVSNYAPAATTATKTPAVAETYTIAARHVLAFSVEL